MTIASLIDTPSELTKTQEDLLRQLAAERGEVVAPAEAGRERRGIAPICVALM